MVACVHKIIFYSAVVTIFRGPEVTFDMVEVDKHGREVTFRTGRGGGECVALLK